MESERPFTSRDPLIEPSPEDKNVALISRLSVGSQTISTCDSLPFRRQIRQQPELMDLVRNRLEYALSGSRLSESSQDALRECQTILFTHSLNEVLEILTEESDDGQRLRQSSPFSGILSQRERLEVFRRYKQSHYA
jgi:hypothetical protein